MYGCPNRCKHCWLGYMPNKKMKEDTDIFLIEYFKPYFKEIAYYSWLREPDYCDDYRKRWERDKQVSIGILPERFELASFWRLVRDNTYVTFLKEVGVQAVQLTFFGMENLTDTYVGRKGAFSELLKATELLLQNGIAPRWQTFINEKNKDEIVEVLRLSEKLHLQERCAEIGKEFQFFVHEGSADGENRKLYNIRICKENIPSELIPYYSNYNEIYTEAELYVKLENDSSCFVPYNDNTVTLNVANTMDIYFNFTHMTTGWRIGNLYTDKKDVIIDRVINENIEALELARHTTTAELIARYGNKNSQRVFQEDDYKMYLLNALVEEFVK